RRRRNRCRVCGESLCGMCDAAPGRSQAVPARSTASRRTTSGRAPHRGDTRDARSAWSALQPVHEDRMRDHGIRLDIAQSRENVARQVWSIQVRCRYGNDARFGYRAGWPECGQREEARHRFVVDPIGGGPAGAEVAEPDTVDALPLQVFTELDEPLAPVE